MQISCTITQGDIPLHSSLRWTFQGLDTVNNQKGIQVSKLGPKSSILSIPELDVSHSGVYSCVVSNRIGNISKSVELVVNGTYIKCLQPWLGTCILLATQLEDDLFSYPSFMASSIDFLLPIPGNIIWSLLINSAASYCKFFIRWTQTTRRTGPGRLFGYARGSPT